MYGQYSYNYNAVLLLAHQLFYLKVLQEVILLDYQLVNTRLLSSLLLLDHHNHSHSTHQPSLLYHLLRQHQHLLLVTKVCIHCIFS